MATCRHVVGIWWDFITGTAGMRWATGRGRPGRPSGTGCRRHDTVSKSGVFCCSCCCCYALQTAHRGLELLLQRATRIPAAVTHLRSNTPEADKGGWSFTVHICPWPPARFPPAGPRQAATLAGQPAAASRGAPLAASAVRPAAQQGHLGHRLTGTAHSMAQYGSS